MARQKKILLDNALVSWANAIYFCDQILAGKTTLEVRKNFVAALHNAVELFLKQIMLDNCDYRVAEPRNVEADGEPAKSYYAATDLNTFFLTLDSKLRKEFRSIEFNRLLKQHKDILKDFLLDGDSYKAELTLLNSLRNNETHFYIGRDDYLNESEFLQLYNFMTTFYHVMHEYELLPFFGVSFDDHKKLCFERSPLKSFSYTDAVKSAEIVKKMVKAANGMQFEDYFPMTLYEMTTAIASKMGGMSDSEFNELWTYVEVLDQYNMIDNIQTGSYKDKNPAYGSDYSEPCVVTHFLFELKFNIL